MRWRSARPTCRGGAPGGSGVGAGLGSGLLRAARVVERVLGRAGRVAVDHLDEPVALHAGEHAAVERVEAGGRVRRTKDPDGLARLVIEVK